MVKCLVVFLLLAFPANADPELRSPIERALRALPASSFDNTTDGLTEGDLHRLIATGETDDWRLTKTGPRSAVATAKHPFSTVTVTIHDVGGKNFVRVKTQNEQATVVDYFDFGKGSKLRRFRPSLEIKDAIESVRP